MGRKVVQIGYLIGADKEVLDKVDHIIEELKNRGVLSKLAVIIQYVSKDLRLYIIDFDTAWYLPQTFHQDIHNAGIDSYVTPVFRVDYRVESEYNMAVDVDSTCVVHVKDGYYANYLAPYRIIGVSGVDMI